MSEELKDKARNYFILGIIGQTLNMYSESATNFFKALFAIDDSALFDLVKEKPKNHTERFNMLKTNIPSLYNITDRLFSTYRRTYTKELNKEEVELVKNKVKEAFENAKIAIPTNEEIKTKFEEFIKKGKIIS